MSKKLLILDLQPIIRYKYLALEKFSQSGWITHSWQEEDSKMQRTRKEVGSTKKFVLLSFTREDGDHALNDSAVQAAMTEERLRKVSQSEFLIYRREVLKGGKPEARTVAFGNLDRGPADTGGFPGVPCINTDGKVEIDENWTRGNTGDLWDYDCEFLFVPTA